MNTRLALILMVAVTTGCQVPLVQRSPLDPQDPLPAALLARFDEAAAARTSLTGALRLSLDAPDLRFRRPQRLAVRKPSDLRIEVIGLFGQIAAVLVTDGERYESFEAGSGKFDHGQVTSDLLWRIARIALSPEDAVALLLGIPERSKAAYLSGAYVDSLGVVSLDFRDEKDALRERISFNPDGNLEEFVRFDGASQVAWQANFTDYRDISDSRFAFDVLLSFPEVDATASLKFDQASLDVAIADELFVLNVSERAGMR